MATQSPTLVSDAPMRWATALLRCCVSVRDGDPIAGDLLEEFREEILPTRGWARAQWWYLRQVASFLPCRETRLALHVCATWFAAFCAVALFSVTRDTFAPAYGVTVFLLAVPFSAFYVARRTDWFGLAMAASVILMFAMLLVGAMAVTPPGSLWSPIATGSTLASLSALAGKMSLPVYETTIADALRDARLRTLPRSSC